MTRADHPIVGTWTLKSFTELDTGTQAISYPMGQAARAQVVYTASGHVATIFAAEARNRPAAALVTDAEAVHLFRTMVAFSGRYEIDADQLIYHPEIAWNEAWTGTRQVRHFEIAAGLLNIRSVPAKSALSDATTIMRMTWERLA